MIDLHTHTNESDGTYSPEDLLNAAASTGLDALAITDHDTFAGYDIASKLPKPAGLQLICGIELSTLLYSGADRKTVHLLGYFPHDPPSQEFRTWLAKFHAYRKERNDLLAARLRQVGVDIDVREVEAMGKSIAGRPHFALLMIRKGYVRTISEAFDRYIGEQGAAFVEREGPELTEGIRRVIDAGGIPSLAHPVRLGAPDGEAEEKLIALWAEAGLRAIEVYHSDHSPAAVTRYTAMAERYKLLKTGGSDFHGAVKPNVRLGQANVPNEVLDALRR